MDKILINIDINNMPGEIDSRIKTLKTVYSNLSKNYPNLIPLYCNDRIPYGKKCHDILNFNKYCNQLQNN